MDIAIYTRVSTREQSTEQQEVRLRDWADRAGHNVVAVFTDVASGVRAKRPGLAALQEAITQRRVQLVAVVALDRLGRSLADLVKLLAEWEALGCALYSAREGIDASTPAGRALLQMAGVFAEFERSLIVERTKAGLDRARRKGKRLGRPPIPSSIRARAERMLINGISQSRVRRELRLGGNTVHKIVNALREEGLIEPANTS